MGCMVLSNTGVLQKTWKLKDQHHATIGLAGKNRHRLAWLWSLVMGPGKHTYQIDLYNLPLKTNSKQAASDLRKTITGVEIADP